MLSNTLVVGAASLANIIYIMIREAQLIYGLEEFILGGQRKILKEAYQAIFAFPHTPTPVMRQRAACAVFTQEQSHLT